MLTHGMPWQFMGRKKVQIAPLFLALLGLLVLSVSPAIASLPKGVELTAAPAWTENVEIDFTRDQTQHSEYGITFLLHDRQELLPEETTQQHQSYIRNLWRFDNSSGVADNSNINISFDPAYEQLYLHKIIIHRDDQQIDKTADSRFTLLHKEENSDYLIYNGKKELDIVLRDVRVGDIIEYSYTIAGHNPVFKGLTELTMATNWGSYVDLARYRILTPASRPLSIRRMNTDAAVQSRTENEWIEYKMAFEEVFPQRTESNQPDWYFGRGYVVFSNFASWGDVAAWEAPLYENALAQTKDAAEIKSLAVKLSSGLSSDEEKIVAALRWVQDEIRYLGLEIGQSTHLPSTAKLTLARRFGDCKDKSVLLTALLREMGIEAHPALVNTDYGSHLPSYPFRLHAFDHALVYVRHDINAYWLDPTRTYQRGSLGDFEQPDYGFALILAAGTDSLTSMKNTSAAGKISVTTDLYMSDIDPLADKIKPSELFVTTEKKGVAAERERRRFATKHGSYFDESYQDYYTNNYGSATLTQPIQLTEEASNTTKKTEKYSLSEFTNGDADCDCPSWVYADEIHSWIDTPQNWRSRKTPYALSHPLQIEETFTIHTSFELQKHTSEITEDNPHFSFTKRVKTDPDSRTVTLNFSYMSKKDHIAVEDLKAYTKSIEVVYDQASYEVSTHRLESLQASAELSKEDLMWLKYSLYMFLIFMVIACTYGLMGLRKPENRIRIKAS